MSEILKVAENIRALLPKEVQRHWVEQEAQQAKLSEQMRVELADCLGRISDALRYPRIAKADLLEAQKYLNRAVMLAIALDAESL
jgi:hypothetical protein